MSERVKRKKSRGRRTDPEATTSGASGATKRAKNLLLDVDALEHAESFSRQHGTTVSRLVSDYLRSLPVVRSEVELPPAVRRLYGLAAGGTADRQSYREHLNAKYGER